MPPKPLRPFRILALPLARLPAPSSSAKAGSEPPKPKTLLILYQVLQPERATASARPAPSSSSPASTATSTGAGAGAGVGDKGKEPPPPPKEPLLNRALARASDEWLKLGNKPEGSWMLWFYRRGERLMDRIEYEEWALKSIQEGRGVRISKDGQPEERIEVALLKPELDPPLPALLPKLHRTLLHRAPYHRKMMWRALVFSPVTWPFALIPIIPNFPLFYVLWRAWSHWKAYRGATYLEQLLKAGLIVEKSSPELTAVYHSQGVVVPPLGAENAAPDSTSSDPAALSSPSSAAGAGTASSPGDGEIRLSNSGVAGAGAEVAGKEGEKRGLPGQAKGESEGAADGTTTPKEMLYSPPTPDAASSSGLTSTPKAALKAAEEQSKAEAEKSRASASVAASTAIPITGSTTAPRPRHPSLLLRPNQVAILARAFALRASELNDVNRAVEQADLRARKADEAAAASKDAGKGGNDKGGPGAGAAQATGTQWRGNLHR